MDDWSADSGQPEKVAYLYSLTRGELGAYCTGVLSRAALTGTATEVRSWQRLLRQVVAGAR
jgi:hypothetical protein